VKIESMIQPGNERENFPSIRRNLSAHKRVILSTIGIGIMIIMITIIIMKMMMGIVRMIVIGII